MSQRFRSLNLTGSVNPIIGHPQEGDPMTPVFYDVLDGSLSLPFVLGIGGKGQIPTQDLAHSVTRSWRWWAARCGVSVDVTPTLTMGTTGVTAAAPFSKSLSFDVGDQSDPSPPGPDYTGGGGGSAPITGDGTYDFYIEEGYYELLCTYTDPGASDGIEFFYMSFVMSVAIDRDQIYTTDVDLDGVVTPGFGVVYWGNISFSITPRYFHSGPDIPFEPCDGPPVTESGDNIALPEAFNSVFVEAAPYLNEYDFGTDDSIASTSEQAFKVRTTSASIPVYTPVTPTGGMGIAITFYAANRAGI